MAFAITPTTFISILSGYFLGWLSVPFVVFSYLGAAIIGYFIAKKIDGGRFIKSLDAIPGIESVLKNLKDRELYITFLAKISPILPFALSNFLLSIGGANLKNFTIGSLLGMLPRTALAIYLGNEAQKLSILIENGSTGLEEQVLIVLLILIGAVGLFRVFKKALIIT
ncbi:TVP38/TMEM64 family protein [Flexithrix dorotheae]|uniref:TVP38/TMEM64 family protein n=1 Tax=Flexithrix dorotheae TaxID=70993 RepID=UPI0012F9F988|nr:VTT domain-containing protein [Flexithrix dorotheae]